MSKVARVFFKEDKYCSTRAQKNNKKWSLQVNIFQKHLFLHQLTHNMTKDCSLNIFVLRFRTIYVTNMFWACNNSMKLSYCGLVDAKIKDSDKDLPLWKMLTSLLPYFQKHFHSSGFLKKQKKNWRKFPINWEISSIFVWCSKKT